jgi:hypothetical protein
MFNLFGRVSRKLVPVSYYTLLIFDKLLKMSNSLTLIPLHFFKILQKRPQYFRGGIMGNPLFPVRLYILELACNVSAFFHARVGIIK